MDKKFHIAFDMDDTLCSLMGPVIELARRLFGRQLKVPGYGQYTGWFPGQLSADERTELIANVYKEDFYLSLPSNFSPLHKSNIELVSKIAWENYKSVRIITARGFVLGDKAEAITREWLRQQKFIDADTVPIHTHEHSVKKLTFCQGPTVMVEDSITVADDFVKAEHHHVILIDQIWNMGHPKHKQLTRVPTRNLHSALLECATLGDDIWDTTMRTESSMTNSEGIKRSLHLGKWERTGRP
jgi:hypothetical protein